jgi:hypothetical protein
MLRLAQRSFGGRGRRTWPNIRKRPCRHFAEPRPTVAIVAAASQDSSALRTRRGAAKDRNDTRAGASGCAGTGGYGTGPKSADCANGALAVTVRTMAKAGGGGRCHEAMQVVVGHGAGRFREGADWSYGHDLWQRGKSARLGFSGPKLARTPESRPPWKRSAGCVAEFGEMAAARLLTCTGGKSRGGETALTATPSV